MNKNFIDTALQYLSLNSQSYDYHLGFWKNVLKNFPSNKDNILGAINSKIFDWKNDSNFSEKFVINPLAQAISESEYIIDIVYPDLKNVNYQNNEDPAKRLMFVYEKLLKVKTYQEMLQLHPLMNRLVPDEILFSFLIRKRARNLSTLKLDNLVQNCVLLFFEEFFFTPILHPKYQLTAKQFWDLVAHGIHLPVSRILDLFSQPFEYTVFQESIIKKPILEFASSGKLPH